MSRKVANLKWHPGWLKSIYNQVFGSKMTKRDLVMMFESQNRQPGFLGAGIFDIENGPFSNALKPPLFEAFRYETNSG